MIHIGHGDGARPIHGDGGRLIVGVGDPLTAGVGAILGVRLITTGHGIPPVPVTQVLTAILQQPEIREI